MGIYITKPITEKDSCDEESNNLKCGSCCMQGWRTSQEDAHNTILSFDKDGSFFAVYDGHGGHEVAEYTAIHFPEFILNNKSYKQGNFEKALIDSFLEFDSHLLKPDVLSTLKKMAGSKKGEPECESTDGEDEEEISLLKKEATMPIDELLSPSYTEKCSSRLLKKQKDGSSSQESSSSKKKSSTASVEDIKIKSDRESSANESGDADSSSDDSSSDKKKNIKVKDSPSNNGTLETNGRCVSPKKDNLVNGSNTKDGSDARTLDTDDSASVNGTSDVINGSVTDDTELIVEGKAIALSSNDGEETPATEGSPKYTGKGKSGGKGGKVKGSSAITTTTVDTPAVVPTPVAAKVKLSDELKIIFPDPLKAVLAADDLNSEDEEDVDETFALDKADNSDDEEEDLEEEEDVEEEEDSSDEECEEEEEPCVSEEDAEIYNEFYATMDNGPGFDSGCTACVALLHRDQLFVANVGDSRCVVSRAGQAIDMSVDHKPEDEIETDRITKAGGRITYDGRVNGGLNLSRALGDHGYKQNAALPAAEQMISPMPDIQVLQLTQEDEFVIIACDGIWNSLSSQEAVDFVDDKLKENPDTLLSAICGDMFEHCLAPNLEGDGTGCDNMTCIILSLKDKTFSAVSSSALSAPQSSEIKSDETAEAAVETKGNKDDDDAASDSKKSVTEDTPVVNGVDVAAKDASTTTGSKRPSDDATDVADGSSQSSDETRPNKKPKIDQETPDQTPTESDQKA